MSTSDPRNVGEYTVSELSHKLKATVEDTFSYVRVRGELGRISRPGSGHVYLDLKDERAVLAGVIWKGVASRLQVAPEQGLEVIVTGKLTTYPGQSKYQIVIESMEPAGLGALMALLEERKKKLKAEGLFDEDRKKPLPHLPAVIGIVTSPTGAVIRDMMHGFNERFPSHVIVWPVRVQGDKSAEEIAAAIKGFNAITGDQGVPRPDILIVARGGGSLEDLWSFNEEIVARAAATSDIPLISAVGHETDWTLIDFVADARAPTPTKAAEWAVPKYSDLLDRIRELALRLSTIINRLLENRRSLFIAQARGLPRIQDLVALPRQRFDMVAIGLAQALRANTNEHKNRFIKLSGRLEPSLQHATLKRRLIYNKITSRLNTSTISHRLQNSHARLSEITARSLRALENLVLSKRAVFEGGAQNLKVSTILTRLNWEGERLSEHSIRIGRALKNIVIGKRAAFEQEAQHLKVLDILNELKLGHERLSDLSARSKRALANTLTTRRRLLESQSQLLNSLGHHNVLARGFALVRDENGNMVRERKGLSAGQYLDVEFSDGALGVHVADGPKKEKNQESPLKTANPKKVSEGPKKAKQTTAESKKKSDVESQGSLF